MIEINAKRYLEILEELVKLEEKYNIHFKETTDSYILLKKDMYDINWRE